ncbi:MAG: GntR family transcriptional regulator [Nocardioidaceae bacterium]
MRSYLVDMLDGGLTPHSKLPTERDLAERFSVSRLTVRRVLDRLEKDGRVYRVQGAGTFVGEPRISKSVELTSFSEDMRARGLVPGSRRVQVEKAAAGADIGFALGLSPADEVICVQRLRTADDEPMCLERSYLPTALVPDLALQPGDSLYELLVSRYGVRVVRAEQRIRVTVLDPDDAKMLSTAPFSPAFLVERTGFDGRGRAIERALSLYRGDRYSYDMTIFRQ